MRPDTGELDEDVDIDPKVRTYVLEMHGRLKGLSHYEALGVSRQADVKAVKRAYFNAVGMIHPDRYFGKQLGSFKPKMEQIFARLTDAYDTLLSTEKRARYDAALGRAVASPSAHPAPAIPRAPVDPRVLAKRQAAIDALKQRYAEGKAKARQHAEAGNRARASQDFVAAAEAYRTALTFSPDDAALQAAYAEVQRAAEERVAQTHERQALLEERHGHWAEAVESWKRVVMARPEDGEAKNRLEAALARAGRGGGERAR